MSIFVEKISITISIPVSLRVEVSETLDKHINRIVRRDFVEQFIDGLFVFSVSNIKHSAFNVKDPTNPTVKVSFTAHGNRIFVGQILIGVKIDKTLKALSTGFFPMRFSRESRGVETIIISARNTGKGKAQRNRPFSPGEIVNVVVLGFLSPESGETIQVLGSEFDAVDYLDRDSILPTPRFISHFGKIPSFQTLKVGSPEFFIGEKASEEMDKLGLFKIGGGGAVAKKPPSSSATSKRYRLATFYEDHFTTKTSIMSQRYLELIKLYVLPRIIARENVVLGDKSPNKIAGKILKGKQSKKAMSRRKQIINFVSDSKDIVTAYKLKGVNDFVIYDGPLEDVPENIKLIDIFRPLCSDKYFVILNADGNEISREYSRLILEYRKDNDRKLVNLGQFADEVMSREDIKSLFSSYKASLV